MKKSMKILSLALVLVMALSVMILPASAAGPAVKAEVVSSYEGKTSGGYDYYKFSVYLDSTLSLNAYQLNVSWDDAVWQMLRATTKADFNTFNVNVIDRNDPANIMYKACAAYQEYGLDGANGQWDTDMTDAGYGYMPGDQGAPSFAKLSNTNMGSELVSAGYTGFYSAWAGDFTDHYLCLSGGTVNGANSPTSGKVMVLSWYMRLKDGVAPGNYEVGFNAKQAYQLTAQYCFADAVTTKECSDQLADVPAENISYSNAIITVGGETTGPVVSKNVAQVKMTLNDEKTAPVISAANPFSLRVISEISEEDWNSYFEPTVVDGKVTTNIKRVGIVGYKGDGTFDMATAVEVAKGADVADYQAADTTYIQKKDGESAKFGARIDFKAQGNIKDVTYVAFVEYGNGEYAFYAEPATAKLLTSYETIVNSYIGFVNK